MLGEEAADEIPFVTDARRLPLARGEEQPWRLDAARGDMTKAPARTVNRPPVGVAATSRTARVGATRPSRSRRRSRAAGRVRWRRVPRRAMVLPEPGPPHAEDCVGQVACPQPEQAVRRASRAARSRSRRAPGHRPSARGRNTASACSRAKGPAAVRHPGALAEVDGIEGPAPSAPGVRRAAEGADATGVEPVVRVAGLGAPIEVL